MSEKDLSFVFVCTNISSGCGISKSAGHKTQEFWSKINIIKGDHCMSIRQKLDDKILGQKTPSKLELIFLTKNGP